VSRNGYGPIHATFYENGYGTNNAADVATAAGNAKKAEADIFADLEYMKQKMDAHKKAYNEALYEINASIKFNKDLLVMLEHKMEVNRDDRKEWTTACNEATDTEPDLRMMQSIEEHQDNPKGEAAVMLIGEQRKRPRVCNLVTERPPEEEGKDPRRSGSRRNRPLSAGRCPAV
jgi:hypothetical protein